MYLKLCTPLIQLRIHFLRAWACHGITGRRSSRLSLFKNLGNYRQIWRFFSLQIPPFLGRYQFSIWSSQRSMRLMQTQEQVRRVLFRLVATFRNNFAQFHLVWEAFRGDWNLWYFDLHPVLTAIKDKKVPACLDSFNFLVFLSFS